MGLFLNGCTSYTSFSAEKIQKQWQSKNHSGLAALKKGDYVQAQILLQNAVETAEQFGDGDPRLCASLNNLGSVYDAQGNYQEAEASYRRAIAVAEKFQKDQPTETLVLYSNLAHVENELNRYKEATENYKLALYIMQNTSNVKDLDFADALSNLADAYAKLEKYNLAEPIYRQALTYDAKCRTLSDPKTINHLKQYASVRAMHRLTEADRINLDLKTRAKPGS